jgi:hypothetical protein
MTALLKIVDEHFGKGRDPAFELRLASERITARELIRRRTAEEVAQVNQRQNDVRLGATRSFLIRHAAVEAKLNTPKSRPIRLFDEREEFEAAVRAFEQNRFVMLFDDRQITDLDEDITVTPTSEMVFLRLVPLVGG